VLYVLTLETNLLSAKELTKQGDNVKFEGDTCSILKGNKTYTEGKITDELYELRYERANCVKQHPQQNCIHQWHMPAILNGYSPDDVFNIDEMGVFYKLLPNRTLRFRGENVTSRKCKRSADRSNMHQHGRYREVVIASHWKIEESTWLYKCKKSPCWVQSQQELGWLENFSSSESFVLTNWWRKRKGRSRCSLTTIQHMPTLEIC